MSMPLLKQLKQLSQPNLTTTETRTGRYYKGKEEYVKLITIDSLPSATHAYVPTGLNNITLTDFGIQGRFESTNIQRSFSSENVYSSGISMGITAFLNKSGATMTLLCRDSSGNNYSGEISIYYTKN